MYQDPTEEIRTAEMPLVDSVAWPGRSVFDTRPVRPAPTPRLAPGGEQGWSATARVALVLAVAVVVLLPLAWLGRALASTERTETAAGEIEADHQAEAEATSTTVAGSRQDSGPDASGGPDDVHPVAVPEAVPVAELPGEAAGTGPEVEPVPAAPAEDGPVVVDDPEPTTSTTLAAACEAACGPTDPMDCPNPHYIWASDGLEYCYPPSCPAGQVPTGIPGVGYECRPAPTPSTVPPPPPA